MPVSNWIVLNNWMWHKNAFSFSVDAEAALSTVSVQETPALHREHLDSHDPLHPHSWASVRFYWPQDRKWWTYLMFMPFVSTMEEHLKTMKKTPQNIPLLLRRISHQFRYLTAKAELLEQVDLHNSHSSSSRNVCGNMITFKGDNEEDFMWKGWGVNAKETNGWCHRKNTHAIRKWKNVSVIKNRQFKHTQQTNENNATWTGDQIHAVQFSCDINNIQTLRILSWTSPDLPQ